MHIDEFAQFEPVQAFLVQGGEQTYETIINSLVEKRALFSAQSLPRFTIDEARTLVMFNRESNEGSIYIAYFSVFSPEAAEAMLKTLEEPNTGVRIIFITPYPYLLPATIRSRMMLLATKKEETKESKKSILEQIKKEASEKEDDAATRRSRAVALLDTLETSIDTPAQALSIYKAKEMIFKANMPTKYVLEYVLTMID
jgi:DNA polymerase III gamma/tau subunit